MYELSFHIPFGLQRVSPSVHLCLNTQYSRLVFVMQIATERFDYIPGKLQFMLFEEYNEVVYCLCVFVLLLRLRNFQDVQRN